MALALKRSSLRCHHASNQEYAFRISESINATGKEIAHRAGNPKW